LPQITVSELPQITVFVSPQIDKSDFPQMTLAALPQITVAALPQITVLAFAQITVAELPQMTVSPQITVLLESLRVAKSAVSENARPFGTIRSLAIVTVLIEPRSTEAIAAITSRLPAPPPEIPDSAKNELVNCRTALASRGAIRGRCSSSIATAPLTTPAAMLVPDNCM